MDKCYTATAGCRLGFLLQIALFLLSEFYNVLYKSANIFNFINKFINFKYIIKISKKIKIYG